uniref:Uncharacterized protein n=1 Tax=viral metagenome TaxID=1070528 RepID=A0A6C0BW32_9ZZZZ
MDNPVKLMDNPFKFYKFENFEGGLCNSKCQLVTLAEKKTETNRNDLTKFAIRAHPKDPKLPAAKAQYNLIFYIEDKDIVPGNPLNEIIFPSKPVSSQAKTAFHDHNTEVDNKRTKAAAAGLPPPPTWENKEDLMQAITWLYGDVTHEKYIKTALQYIKNVLGEFNVKYSDKLTYENKTQYIKFELQNHPFDEMLGISNFSETEAILLLKFNGNVLFQHPMANIPLNYLTVGSIVKEEEHDLIKSNIFFEYYCLPWEWKPSNVVAHLPHKEKVEKVEKLSGDKFYEIVKAVVGEAASPTHAKFTMKNKTYKRFDSKVKTKYKLLNKPSDNIFIRETVPQQKATIFASEQYDTSSKSVFPIEDVQKIDFTHWSRETEPVTAIFSIKSLKPHDARRAKSVKAARQHQASNKYSLDLFGYYGHLPFMNIDFSKTYNSQKDHFKNLTGSHLDIAGALYKKNYKWASRLAAATVIPLLVVGAAKAGNKLAAAAGRADVAVRDKNSSLTSLATWSGLFKLDGPDYLSSVPFRLKLENDSVIGVYNFYHIRKQTIPVDYFLKNYLLRVENTNADVAVWKEKDPDVPLLPYGEDPQKGGNLKYIKPKLLNVIKVKSYPVNSFEAESIKHPEVRQGFPLVPALTFNSSFDDLKKMADLDKFFLNLDEITVDKINALGINELSGCEGEGDRYKSVKDNKRELENSDILPFARKKINDDLLRAEENRDNYVEGKEHGNERMVFKNKEDGKTCEIDIDDIIITKNKTNLPFIPNFHHPFMSYFINLEYTNPESQQKFKTILIDMTPIEKLETYYNDETSNAKRVYNKFMDDETELWKNNTEISIRNKDNSKNLDISLASYIEDAEYLMSFIKEYTAHEEYGTDSVLVDFAADFGSNLNKIKEYNNQKNGSKKTPPDLIWQPLIDNLKENKKVDFPTFELPPKIEKPVKSEDKSETQSLFEASDTALGLWADLLDKEEEDVRKDTEMYKDRIKKYKADLDKLGYKPLAVDKLMRELKKVDENINKKKEERKNLTAKFDAKPDIEPPEKEKKKRDEKSYAERLLVNNELIELYKKQTMFKIAKKTDIDFKKYNELDNIVAGLTKMNATRVPAAAAEQDNAAKLDHPMNYPYRKPFVKTNFRNLVPIDGVEIIITLMGAAAPLPATTFKLLAGGDYTIVDLKEESKIKSIKMKNKTYTIITNFQAGMLAIFREAAILTDTEIQFSGTTTEGKFLSSSIPNRFKKNTMKDFLNLLRYKDVTNAISGVPPPKEGAAGGALVDDVISIPSLLSETTKRFITTTKEFVGEPRIKALNNRKSGQLQEEILKKYVEKEKAKIVIVYGAKSPPNLGGDYQPPRRDGNFTVFVSDGLDQPPLLPGKARFTYKTFHNRMRIPTMEFPDPLADKILSNLYIKEKEEEGIAKNFRFNAFKYLDSTTTTLLPKKELTVDHRVYHPEWGLFSNKWDKVNPYNVSLALKRIFNHIKLNRIIYIFDNDEEDEDADKYQESEQSRLINMIDKWNYISDKTRKMDNVIIDNVELITNRDDASLTLMYILKYKKTEENNASDSGTAFYERVSGRDVNGLIKYDEQVKLAALYNKFTGRKSIEDVIKDIAKNIYIELFVGTLETQIPDMVERFLRHNGTGQSSGLPLIERAKNAAKSGASGMKRSGVHFINGVRQETFHIPFHIRNGIKFTNREPAQRKKIKGWSQNGGEITPDVKLHSGKGILKNAEYITDMLKKYYGCDNKTKTCTEYGNFNHLYKEPLEQVFGHLQVGGKANDGVLKKGEFGPPAKPPWRSDGPEFESRNTLQFNHNIKYSGFEMPDPNHHKSIPIYDAWDDRLYPGYLYPWAHPLNFGDNKMMKYGYGGLSAIGSTLFTPRNPRGQSTAKTNGVENTRNVLNPDAIPLAREQGVNEHNIPFFLSNPDNHATKTAWQWEKWNNIQEDPYGPSEIRSYFGANKTQRKLQTTLRRFDDVRHRKNSATLNFGGKTPQNIFEPREGIPENEDEVISERQLIKHLINVVLPSAQNRYLQSDNPTKEEEATISRGYGRKSFL